MIALISGKIVYKGISHVIVDVHGVGYRIFIPLTTFYELPEAGQTITLHVHTNVKQDAINLFGFYTVQERDLFQLMISVSGIGPKMSMNILSGISAQELLIAISGGHVEKLIKIPGVGKKMAERLILELKEKVLKNEMKAEADRYFNYPYDALEEALCNAVYHQGYDNDSTIEMRIYPSRIDIISYPGPLPPLNKEKLKNNQFDVRKYRNRRIGEFLKELHLTEGRATGIPTIIKALDKNQSPKPVFETDDERTYFKTTFYTNSYFDIGSLVKEINSKQIDLIKFCVVPKSREEIFSYLKLSNHFTNYNKYLVPLIKKYIINRTSPDSPKARKQKYYNSSLGAEILAYLQNNAE